MAKKDSVKGGPAGGVPGRVELMPSKGAEHRDMTVRFELGRSGRANTEDREMFSSLRGQLGSPSAIKSLLSRATLVRADFPLEFGVFLEHLSGASKFMIMDSMRNTTHPVFLLQTNNNSFMLCDLPVAQLYEIPGLISADFKESCELKTDKGKALYMSRVYKRELKAIFSIAVQEKAAPGGPGSLSTIVPKEGSDIVEFKFKLRSCRVAACLEDGFDVKRFADSVKFIAPFAEEEGRGCYLIYAGVEEDIFMLYVNAKPPASPSHVPFCTLSYGDSDKCVLCREA